MDQFGVLTERYGLKPQGKSAPMASSKRPAPAPANSNLNASSDGFPADIFFQSNPNKNSTAFDDDVFAQFQSSTSSSYNYNDDDVFGLNSTSKDGVFGSFGSVPKHNGSLDDDLLGGFAGSNISTQNDNAFDGLIPGFESTTPPVNGVKATNSTFMSAEDPFIVFESMSSRGNISSDPFTDPWDELGKISQSKPNVSKSSSILKPPPRPADKVTTSGTSLINELEDFAMGKAQNSSDRNFGLHQSKDRNGIKSSKYKEAEHAPLKPHKGGDDLEDFFSSGSRSSSAPKSRASTTDPIFDMKSNGRGPDIEQKKSSRGSSAVRRVSSANSVVDDLSSMFGAASVFGEFEEFEGEPEERRRARLGRQMRTNDRIAQAVADMNQRDFQTQQEQEERSRIADALNIRIKHWAAGKEGNMRALLSSLQQVLWPGCGWEPVSLTDLITSTSVKKVYRKAALFVHPDKVQQKGATIEQKFIAEKVFDILKEAWNKFNKEELS